MSTVVAQSPSPQTEAQRQPSTSESVPVPEVKEQDKQLSPQYAAIARREKAIRTEAQRLKAERQALDAKKTEYETNYIPKSQISEKLKSNFLGFANEYGLSGDEITAALLNQPGPESQAISKLESKIQELESKLAQTETKQSESQTKAYEQAVNQIRNDVKTLVQSDPAFETVKETDSTEAVVELIKETFDKGWEEKNIPAGTILSTEQAAEFIETYLVEEAIKMANLNKVKSKLAPQPAADQKTNQPQKTQQMTTLTNAIASSKTMSPKERAILAFRGQLK